MNSNAFFRPIIKSILHRDNYKEHGQQYEEFMALEDIIGISYNLPKKFSNGIIPPHEIKCVNKSQISLKSFIEDGKLQQHMQRDENDFYMKEQPYSPFKYINTNLHNKIIKLQLNIYRNKQIAYMQRKKQIEDQKKAIQQAQMQAQQQYRNHNRNINGAPIPLMTPRNVNVTAHPTHSTHTPPVPTPGPPIPSGPGSAGAIPISRTAYNALTKPYMNGHSAHTHINRGRYNGRVSAVNALAIPRQRYNGMINGVDVPSIPRQSSYSSNNSINTQQSHNTIASITSRNTHTSSIYNTSNRTGHINSINSHGGVGVPPAVSVPSLPMSGTPVPTPVLNIHHRGGPNSVGPGSVTTSVVPQAQYPSHLPTQTVPSPFVNSGRNSVGPPGQPPNMLRRDSINTNVTQGSHNSVPNINVYRGYTNRNNNGNNRGRSNSITPSAVNVNRNNVNINNHMNMVNNIIRPPRYDTANINVNTNDNGSHYNASPSDTQITNISALTQQTTPGPGSGVTPIPLTSAHLNINNSNNNPSPQSINSNHTNYTGVSQHSTSQMTYRGNNQSTGHVNNGIPLTNTSHRLYSAGAIVGPTDLIRNPTTDSEMYMPSIGC